MTVARRVSLLGLCSLMGGSGTLHFLVPGLYRRIIPTMLRPWATALVAVSGAGEIACAMLLAIPRTRRVGALVTSGLLVAVFPANVQMALDAAPGQRRVMGWMRLPLQVPLLLWAWSFRRNDTSRQ